MFDLFVAQFATLLQNQVFAGLSGAAVIGWVLYIVRFVPQKIVDFVYWRYVSRLTIRSEDEAYEKVNEWLAGLEYSNRCRNMRLISQYDEEQQKEVEVFSPGLGNHYLFYKGWPLMVSRSLPDKGGIGSWKRFEDIEIRTFGKDPRVIRELVEEIRLVREKKSASSVSIYLYRFRWRLASRKPKRSIDSVVLASRVKEDLITDIKRFIASRKWYGEHGVPYRRGYLFQGAPGSGKTSLVIALAGVINRPIYALNLGSLSNDDELIDAVNDVPEHACLLIEDIDAAKATAKRVEEPSNTPADPSTPAKKQEKEISLSALLNAIDGVFSRDGRILFMTTNHPEKVDQALFRTGRADRKIDFGPLGREEIERMCARFIPSKAESIEFATRVGASISPSDLQEMLVQQAMETRVSIEEEA